MVFDFDDARYHGNGRRCFELFDVRRLEYIFTRRPFAYTCSTLIAAPIQFSHKVHTRCRQLASEGLGALLFSPSAPNASVRFHCWLMAIRAFFPLRNK